MIKKPCCQQVVIPPGQSHGGIQFFPGLDAADTALTIAYTEVPVEQRENIDLMRQLIQKIRAEAPRSKAAQWQSYFMVLEQKILPYIGCPYCRMATQIDLSGGGMVHMLFERGLYKKGLVICVKRDAQKYWWFLKAYYHRIILSSRLVQQYRSIRIKLRPLKQSSPNTPVPNSP